MSNSHNNLDLEFKKAELKRKQLENRKFEAEVKSLELDVELKAQVQEFEVIKAKAEALKQQAIAKRESSRSNWLMVWVVFFTGVVTWLDNVVALIKKIFGF